MIATDPDEDQILMCELGGGNELALNRLMQRWSGRVISYLERLCGNHATACDLAQEVFVRVYKNRHRFRPECKFSTWLYAIATNLARNHARWHQRHPLRLVDPATLREGAPACHQPPPDQHAELSEQARRVRDAIEALPDDQREALLLSVFEGLSHQEIADILSTRPKVIEMRLYRARKALAAQLQKDEAPARTATVEAFSGAGIWGTSSWSGCQ
jgi:RNA polymerase sigma-70 factor (ECF subfamily)